jgi:hypothetical protein
MSSIRFTRCIAYSRDIGGIFETPERFDYYLVPRLLLSNEEDQTGMYHVLEIAIRKTRLVDFFRRGKGI